jgi:hypothetical protein
VRWKGPSIQAERHTADKSAVYMPAAGAECIAAARQTDPPAVELSAASAALLGAERRVVAQVAAALLLDQLVAPRTVCCTSGR